MELKRIAPPLKTVYRPMSPDHFFALNSYKIELLLSYDFHIRKQERKYFFCRSWTLFFPEKLSLKR